jgi:hypothetical protein
MEMDISHRDTETQSFRDEEAGMSLCLRGSVGCDVGVGDVSHRGAEAQRNIITGDILDASVKIHKLFGPGLLESVMNGCWL